MTKEIVTERLKVWLSLDPKDKHGMLCLMVDDAITAVQSYCHRKDFPDALECVVRNLVMRKYKSETDGEVASVKRGDTQITYAQPIGAESLSEQDKAILNAHRKMVMS